MRLSCLMPIFSLIIRPMPLYLLYAIFAAPRAPLPCHTTLTLSCRAIFSLFRHIRRCRFFHADVQLTPPLLFFDRDSMPSSLMSYATLPRLPPALATVRLPLLLLIDYADDYVCYRFAADAAMIPAEHDVGHFIIRYTTPRHADGARVMLRAPFCHLHAALCSVPILMLSDRDH